MKMCNKFVLAAVSIILILFLVWIVIFINNGQIVGEFDVSEDVYQELITEFAYDARFSKINNREDAVNVADHVLKERFPQVNLYKFYPYDVDYDKSNDCWLVVGRQPLCKNIKRAEPYVIINGDGTVLAVLMWG